MAAVAIATSPEFPELDDEGRLLLGALRDLGVTASPAIWRDEPAGGWAQYDLVVVRGTWDYTFALADFLAWTRAIGPDRLHNPPDVIAWNADKRYLVDLARADINTIATEHLVPGVPFTPPPAGRFVVKPAVAGGARGAQVFDDDRHEAAAALVAKLHARGDDVLVQPYLDAVDGDEGEIALIFIEGELSHAMHKGPLLALDVPAVESGFRAEEMRRVAEPAADVVALAHRTLEVAYELGGPLLYARVDVLRDAAGAPAILELELIEPSLFLDFAPGSAQALARAIVARLRL